jgi:hypothetical protein
MARRAHSATLLPNGNVLVHGGDRPSGRSAELFHPDTETWSGTGARCISQVGSVRHFCCPMEACFLSDNTSNDTTPYEVSGTFWEREYSVVTAHS